MNFTLQGLPRREVFIYERRNVYASSEVGSRNCRPVIDEDIFSTITF